MTKEELMGKAIELSIKNVASGGQPFGAVVARNGEIISTGVNQIALDCDPTAHAEMVAIRRAAQVLGTFDLSGCEIFASCEPCPMCIAAIYWSNIEHVYYANSNSDAGEIGFDDSFIYKEISKNPKERRIPFECIMSDEAKTVFKDWAEKNNKG